MMVIAAPIMIFMRSLLWKMVVFFGEPVLKGDAWGYTYTPVASSVLASLKASDGSYYKRVQVGIKLMEGRSDYRGEKVLIR